LIKYYHFTFASIFNNCCVWRDYQGLIYFCSTVLFCLSFVY